MHNTILAFDPSGEFTKGKGCTGICIYHPTNKIYLPFQLRAKDYTRAEDYWKAHVEFIKQTTVRFNSDLVIVAEDFQLYGNKALQQTGSQFETSKLIGIMQQHAFENEIDFYLQRASVVKPRWTDETLEYKGYLWRKPDNPKLWYHYDRDTLMNNHMRDALRHAVHYATFINTKTMQ